MGNGLYAGVRASITGLTAYGKRVAIEADNVSKADATAGKTREAFVLANASSTSVASYNASGVSTAVQQYITTSGDQNKADVSTFMAIRDQGFFPVSSSPSQGLGKSGFTRDGTFEPDTNGNFKNLANQFLMVWPTDSDGNVTATDTTTTSGLIVASTAGLSGTPIASTRVEMNAMLPSSATVGGETFSAPTTIIDSLGVPHQVNFTYQKTLAAPQEWTVQVTCSDATTIGAPYAAGMVIQFDADGNPAVFNGNTTLTAPPALNITWNNAAAPSAIAVNMGTIGESNGLRSIGQGFNSSAVSANGRTPGRFENALIDQATGLIYAQFDNSAVTPFAKIPLATFTNANGLLEGMGGVYTPTIASGSYTLQAVGENGAGTLVTSATEQSTVDTTEQLTMMIVDQANYQANTKTLSVVNDMFQAINQAIR